MANFNVRRIEFGICRCLFSCFFDMFLFYGAWRCLSCQMRVESCWCHYLNFALVLVVFASRGMCARGKSTHHVRHATYFEEAHGLGSK